MKKLEGKIGIVTGSTRGIGCATAKMLAKDGAHVVASGRNEEAGNRVADEICAEGGTAIYASGVRLQGSSACSGPRTSELRYLTWWEA